MTHFYVEVIALNEYGNEGCKALIYQCCSRGVSYADRTGYDLNARAFWKPVCHPLLCPFTLFPKISINISKNKISCVFMIPTPPQNSIPTRYPRYPFASTEYDIIKGYHTHSISTSVTRIPIPHYWCF